jgi:hypothetical protein
MPEPEATEAAERLQTVGQLKEWLKPFSDHDRLLGAIQGQLLSQWVTCRHTEMHVIIEVPRIEQRS